MPSPRSLAGAAVGVALAAWPTVAVAAPAAQGVPDTSPGAYDPDFSATGHYKDQTFRMADGIPEDASCVVTSVAEAWCFATAEEMYASGLAEFPFGAASSEATRQSAVISGNGPVTQATGTIACSSTGSLVLYENINYGGSTLQFAYNWGGSGDYYLGWYGWNDRAASYKNTHCTGRIGFDDYPAGSAYTIFWGGYQLDNMGAWNYRASTLRW